MNRSCFFIQTTGVLQYIVCGVRYKLMGLSLSKRPLLRYSEVSPNVRSAIWRSVPCEKPIKMLEKLSKN
mgnify:CR=1 FL=1